MIYIFYIQYNLKSQLHVKYFNVCFNLYYLYIIFEHNVWIAISGIIHWNLSDEVWSISVSILWAAFVEKGNTIRRENIISSYVCHTALAIIILHIN